MTAPPHLNETVPGGAPGGVIESVKRAMVLALREQLLGSTVLNETARVSSVDLEYPLKLEKYPGIWVQFSFTKLVRAGIAQEFLNQTEVDGRINWEPIQEWSYEGRVSLNIVALSSLERDRISDYLISQLAFARNPTEVLTDKTIDTKQNRALKTSLFENPYVTIAINSDFLTPGGQSVTVGTPWSATVLAYEDVYSFDIFGQFNIIFKNDGTYTLRKIETVPTVWDPYNWH